MKKYKSGIVLLLSAALLFGTSSCLVFVKTDNGKHKGWFKNSNNPHHPNSTNPGKSKDKPRK